MTSTIDLTDPSPPVPWRGIAAWLAAVVIYALVLHFQIGLPLWMTFRQGAVYVLSLAVVSAPARAWARQSLAVPRSAARLVGLHAMLAVATVAAWFSVNLLWDWLLLGPSFWPIIYANNWLFQLLSGLTAYGTVIGLTIAAASFRRERERERREAALLIQARDAELGAIRSQFQPHFVLNALNSLLALIDRDPAAARAMVVRLSDVMKEVFDREDTPLVPLSREIDLVRAYLDVERVRFGPRLAVNIDVADAARHASVPAFLLQPVVENAVKHGIAPFAGPGRVAIAAAIAGRDLVITVSDTGTRGVAEAGRGGRGLALTRRRLQTLFGDRQSLSLTGGPSGTVARIALPATPS
jgi:sensor histidine kinase YesM